MSHPTRRVAGAFESPALPSRARPPSPRVRSLSAATFAPSPSPLVAPSSPSQTPSPFLPPSQLLSSPSQTPPPFLPPSQPVLPLSPRATSLSALPLQPVLPPSPRATSLSTLPLQPAPPHHPLSSPSQTSPPFLPPIQPVLPPSPRATSLSALPLQPAPPHHPLSSPSQTSPPFLPPSQPELRHSRPIVSPLPPRLSLSSPDDRVVFVFSGRRQPNVSFCPAAHRSTRSTWDFDLLPTALLRWLNLSVTTSNPSTTFSSI